MTTKEQEEHFTLQSSRKQHLSAKLLRMFWSLSILWVHCRHLKHEGCKLT